MRADRFAPDERLDRFAELLSLDIPLETIRRRMGVTKGCTSGMMRKLRAKFGWQAQ